MSLNDIFKGRKIIKDLGYGKTKKLKIISIKENVHRYTNGQVVFVNYIVHFKGGKMECFSSLEDLNFHEPLINWRYFKRKKNKTS